MIRHLRRKFIIICMISVFVVMAIVVILINGLNAYRSNDRLDLMLNFIAENNGQFPNTENSTAAMDGAENNKPVREDSWATPSERAPKEPRTDHPFDSAEARFTTRHFSISFDENGVAESVNTQSIAAVTEEEAIEYAEKVLRRGKTSGWYDVYRYRLTNTDSGQLVTFLDGSSQRQSILQFLWISLIVALSICMAVFVLVFLISMRAIRPIVNTIERQRQFITDAGHELKTPLTIISANCEILQINSGTNEWLESITNQTTRMRKLVNNLVTLSRIDEEQPEVIRSRFSLTDAVYDTAMAFSSLAEREGKRLTLRVEPDIFLFGDEAAIRQLTSILLDNAVKYCDVDGEILVELMHAKRTALSVENTCQAVDSLELHRLFDRFYRADQARTGSGSYGLGLSIARSIALAHHGSIRAEKAADKKIRMLVKL